ncbi:MAG: tRNA (N6-isopentenyl adenosine(37)-C2)-methylthiotransferase MiaB [Hyphomicrobiales bacterium]
MAVKKKLYIETYGCQMNFSDSEIVGAIMKENNYEITDEDSNADLILINTCSIRENAEQRIRKRLRELNALKKKNQNLTIGILGCMAERLKEQLLEEQKEVDLIAGPDSYRDLPRLVGITDSGEKAANVILSAEETYADITPVKYGDNKVSAFISIMRGCENFCAYCVVPYTRGKERSRNPYTIIDEVKHLMSLGYKEVTLLGQNVNSYCYESDENNIGFPDLMRMVAEVSPLLRVRFATSHPKDISDKLLEVMALYPNICKHIHLPAQSGSTSMLKRMNRKYSREWYLERMDAAKRYLPDCSITTDIIAGFCGETEEEHKDTLSLMKEVGYSSAFMFKYSERPNTYAAKKMEDDVDDKVKGRRLQEIIALQGELSLEYNKKMIGKTVEVLVEKTSKRSVHDLCGRNSQNIMVVFPDNGAAAGDYVNVLIKECTPATLKGEAV